MNTYRFTLVLDGSLELTDDISDALFAAGCDDGTPGTSSGVFTIDFDRTGTSLEEAINSAVRDVKKAGYDVSRVEIEADSLRQSA